MHRRPSELLAARPVIRTRSPQFIMHPLGLTVRLPTYPPTSTRCPVGGKSAGSATPSRRAVMGEVADRVDDVAHAPAGRAAAAARPAMPGPAAAARTPPTPLRSCRRGNGRSGGCGRSARAAPARHHAGDGSWLDITIGDTVERHEAPGIALDSTPKRLPGPPSFTPRDTPRPAREHPIPPPGQACSQQALREVVRGGLERGDAATFVGRDTPGWPKGILPD